MIHRLEHLLGEPEYLVFLPFLFLRFSVPPVQLHFLSSKHQAQPKTNVDPGKGHSLPLRKEVIGTSLLRHFFEKKDKRFEEKCRASLMFATLQADKQNWSHPLSGKHFGFLGIFVPLFFGFFLP